ncbi:type VI secretion system contractile sheath small subunit [Arenibaculum sp.]|uniref:type VI secretion system contractile sheath small subunit n=1 Tax=Arenibaculum sp. TaxID=2865862 RepID=UPI002E13745C|nr:type VI secretion system contractile sheath small subunit [Arenibaculum sp.]
MAESTQHKLSRVRPPRVQITYDVEIGDAIEKKELPFIVGIMADLSGKPTEPLPPVKDRKFVEIDRDNFNDVLSSASPRLVLRVPNRLKPDGNDMLNAELKFKHMDDFGPVEVMQQVPALKALLDTRQRLRDLLTKLDGNDDLDALLRSVVENTESRSELRTQLGGGADGGDKPVDPPAPE